MKLKFWGLIFFLHLAAVLIGQPKLSVFQSKEQIIWGEPDTLTLVLKSATDAISWIEFKDTLLAEVEVLEYGKIDTGAFEGGWELQQNLIITSFDTGYFVIPPFRILVGGDSVFSNPLLLRVEEGVAEIAPDLLPIADILEEPLSLWEKLWGWGKYVLLIFIIVLIIWYVRYWYLNKKSKIVDGGELIEKTFKERFETELLSIEMDKDWEQGRLKVFYTRTSDLLRRYLEFRFQLKAMEQTTSEITAQLELTGIQQMDRERLVAALRMSDMVKFARSQGASGQHQQMIAVLKELSEHFGFGENE